MPQLLALEWDTTEARIALASGRGEQAVIEQAFAVELKPRQVGGDQAEVDVGARHASALAARGIGRLDALVAIGRTNIELRQLTLPPAPDEDLPEMVRFQAMREFNELDDDWLLDFMPLTDSAEEPRSVLAAAIGPEWIEQIQKVCSVSGVRPRRLVLRACAAAAHLARMQPHRQNELRLLVDLLSDEADLTVMSGGRVVFLRTTRIGGDAAGAQVLLGEIRRTMAAVQNQLGGRKVDSLVVCGQEGQQTELARRMEAELGIPTESFDPFAGLQWGRELQAGLPEHPGRFTPLMGMLLTELDQRPHAVDFLHPRRRPPPPKRAKWYVIAGVAAALALISLLIVHKIQYALLANQVEAMKQELALLDPQEKEANKINAGAAEIEKWSTADIVWLDALYALSKEFPGADDARLTNLTLNTWPKDIKHPAGGIMHLDGLAKSEDELTKMKEKLRRNNRQVIAGKESKDTSLKHYSWIFSGGLVLSHTDALPKKENLKSDNRPQGQSSKIPGRDPGVPTPKTSPPPPAGKP